MTRVLGHGIICPDNMKPSKKTSKKTAPAKSPKFDRLWNTSPFNPNNSPYWEPPHISAELTYAAMCFMDQKGVPFRDEFLYTGSKVEVGGEFFRLNIDINGLAQDLQKAIDEVIKKHTKLKAHDKPTMIVPEEKK